MEKGQFCPTEFQSINVERMKQTEAWLWAKSYSEMLEARKEPLMAAAISEQKYEDKHTVCRASNYLLIRYSLITEEKMASLHQSNLPSEPSGQD